VEHRRAQQRGRLPSARPNSSAIIAAKLRDPFGVTELEAVAAVGPIGHARGHFEVGGGRP